MSRKKKKAPIASPDGAVCAYIRKSVVKWPDGCETLADKEAHVEDLRRVRRGELLDDAARAGLEIDRWYDDMGVSGRGEFLEKREGFARLRADAKAGRVRAVLGRDLSRLFRDFVQQEIWFQEMAALGVSVYADGSLQTGEGPHAKMIRQIIGAVNEAKAEVDGETIRDKLIQKVKQGTWVGRQRSMWGLRYDKTLKSFVPDPETADRIIAVFEAVRRHRGIAHHVVAEFNARLKAGDPTAFYSPRGVYWNTTSVLGLVRNPLYRREVHFSGIVIPDAPRVPQVVPAGLVAEVQELVRLRTQEYETPERREGRRSAGRAIPYTYSGLITCGHCGARVRAHKCGFDTAKKHPLTINPTGVNYTCVAAHNSSAQCPDSFGISHARLDDLIGKALAEAAGRVRSVLAAAVAGAPPATARVPAPEKSDPRKALAALEEERVRCRRAYNAQLTTWEEFTADMESIRVRRERLEAQQRDTWDQAPPATLPRLSAAEWDGILVQLTTEWASPAEGPDGVLAAACDPDKALLLRRLGAALVLTVESRPLRRPRLSKIAARRPETTSGRATVRLSLDALWLTGEQAIVLTETEEAWEHFRHNKSLNRRYRENGRYGSPPP